MKERQRPPNPNGERLKQKIFYEKDRFEFTYKLKPNVLYISQNDLPDFLLVLKKQIHSEYSKYKKTGILFDCLEVVELSTQNVCQVSYAIQYISVFDYIEKHFDKAMVPGIIQAIQDGNDKPAQVLKFKIDKTMKRSEFIKGQFKWNLTKNGQEYWHDCYLILIEAEHDIETD